MDVFHVCFRRLWKYYQKAMHNCRRNTYNFEKDGKKHVILHLRDEGTEEEAHTIVLLMSGKELLEEAKKKEFHFALVQKPHVILTNTNLNDL